MPNGSSASGDGMSPTAYTGPQSCDNDGKDSYTVNTLPALGPQPGSDAAECLRISTTEPKGTQETQLMNPMQWHRETCA